jgi:hypothetical protein
MIDFLWQFEKHLTGIRSPLLLVAAVMTLMAGLFIYLGGFGFRKVMFAVVGFYCGIVCAMLIAGFNLMLSFAFIGAGVLLALWLQDSFLILLASLFAAVYGFSILIRPYFSPSDELLSVIRQLTIGVPFYNWPILLAVIAVPVAVRSASWRAASAVLCSVTATILLLAGDIMLMKHFDFAAVGHISGNRGLYLEIFSRFAAAKESEKAKAKRARKRKTEESQSKITTWRTA